MANMKEYWEQRLKERYNLEGVGCLGHGTIYNKWMYLIRSKIFKRKVRKLRLPKSSRILDVGSGTGFYVQQWLNNGYTNITGSDITTVATNNLANNFKTLTFHQVDIADSKLVRASFKQGEFDCISCFDVLFHIVDDESFNSALANISYLLKPGGFFLLTDNFLHDTSFSVIHQKCHSLSEFENTLGINNFKIISRKPAFYLMNTPVDSNSRFLNWFWRFQGKLISRNRFFEKVVPALIYPLELFLIRLFREGPTLEFMICKKTK